MKRLVLIAMLASAGCATKGQFPVVTTPAAPPGAVEFSLFLIGDAGQPASPEPVLDALKTEMTAAKSGAAVVFLGDNIYPAGLPSATHPDRATMAARLQAQIDSVPAPAKGIFVPGNHDWEKGAAGGLTAIRNESDFIRTNGGTRAEFAPIAGCPGPVVNDALSPRLRLVALDTHWWLHERERGTTSCPEGTEDAVIAALDRALSTAGTRHVILAAHHPMLSSGPHGGFYDWRWLYAWFRILVVRHGQDMTSGEYKHMRSALAEVLRKHKPLLYAGGHEHTQELLRGDSARFFVVSGAGIYGHISPTGRRDETIFKHAASGFMRLDFLTDGRAWLTVLEVDETGKARAVFTQALQ